MCVFPAALYCDLHHSSDTSELRGNTVKVMLQGKCKWECKMVYKAMWGVEEWFLSPYSSCKIVLLLSI